MKRDLLRQMFCGIAAAGWAVVLVSVVQAAQISQDFSSNPPDWVGVNNTSGFNNFGFSNTNNVGLGAGEAGGILARDLDSGPAHYSTQVGTLDPSSEAISFSGTAVYKSPHQDYSMIGYFAPSSGITAAGGYPADFIGTYSDDRYTAVYAIASGSIVGSPYIGAPTQIALDTPWTFDLTYDPNGNGGNGAVTGTVAGTAISLNFPAGFKDSFADLTNFGMHTRTPGADSSGRQTTTFIDNLNYTSEIPEPASSVLIMFVVASASVLRKPWRKGIER